MSDALSRLLIQAISLEYGYGASSLRARIYCSMPGATTSMAAILLITTTPGSEGTLGGLVAQGRRIGDHLVRALELGRLCSNDPVCATHSPSVIRPSATSKARLATAASTSPRSAASA